MSDSTASQPTAPPSLLVIDPNGRSTRLEVKPLPFRIGRQADSHLVLRDSRASRIHAEIFLEEGDYFLRDLDSRFGTWVNGKRITRHMLRDSDRIEFGVPDSYRLTFARSPLEVVRQAEQAGVLDSHAHVPAGSANLARLRAVLEVARTLQTGFSTDDVLCSVVDAALAVTGAERGFLLLRQDQQLEIRVARNRSGASLPATDLRVPRRLIQRALEQRRNLLSMNFDPLAMKGEGLDQSISDLELRSVVCVPLVRIRTQVTEATSLVSTSDETAGVLYMDSRLGAADLAGGNRELLQTLAIEASTVLENARLLEEERAKQRMEEELNLARTIQRDLLPSQLPAGGWFRAAGSSMPSREVGGDYFDVVRVDEGVWSAIVADVSGKGVSAALLASLLQGAFLAPTGSGLLMQSRIERLNRFLKERTGGEKYATIFHCLLDRGGHLHYINAGHCSPLVLRPRGEWEYLAATASPVGLLDDAAFEIRQAVFGEGTKVVVFSDGVTEACNPEGEFFGKKRLREAAMPKAAAPARELLDAIQAALEAFTAGTPQSDDMTVLVLEYAGLA